jgi:predicted GTPase
MPVIALIDGEHHPDAVREALARLDLAGVVFCGGEEKLAAGPLEKHYGRPVETDPEEAFRRLAPGADAVVDLADEPVLPPRAKLRLAALALHLGMRYSAPGLRLDPPRYEPVAFDGPKLAVIATGKRTGKTALACHLARLLRESRPRRRPRSMTSSRSPTTAPTPPRTTWRTRCSPG